MGNRAVITTHGSNPHHALGLYLHWSGGPESVLAFLEAARRYGVCGPKSDGEYSFARLAQIIGNFFGGTASLGVGITSDLDTDNGDNGTYFIGDKFEVIDRREGLHGAAIGGACRVEDLSGESRERYEKILVAVLEANNHVFNKSV